MTEQITVGCVVKLRCGALGRVQKTLEGSGSYRPAELDIFEGWHLLPKNIQDVLEFWKVLRVDLTPRGEKVDVVEVVKQMGLFT